MRSIFDLISLFFIQFYLGDEIENSEESEYFSPETPTPNNNGGSAPSGGGASSYRYPRNSSTPNGRERKRVLR